MPYRKDILVKDQIYHVFNSGVAGLPIFSGSRDYHRFMDLVDYYRFVDTPTSYSYFLKLPVSERKLIKKSLVKSQVEILAFCLMTNHFHLLLKQKTDLGIKTFISKVQNGFAKYYNFKNKRTGPLFQPMFKAVLIETDEQLMHVSRYIHLNPATGYLVEIKDLSGYPWSSLSSYLDESPGLPLVSSDSLGSLFAEKSKYREFVFDQAEYQRELGKIKHLVLE